MTQLLRTIQVRAPFSSVMEYAAAFFLEHPKLRVKALANSSAEVRTEYTVMDDPTDTSRLHESLMLVWTPRWPWFPHFKGLITVRPDDNGSRLIVEATYNPPGASLGKLFDRLVGERLAKATIDHLLHRVAAHVTKAYKQYQAGRPTVEQLNELARAARQPTSAPDL